MTGFPSVYDTSTAIENVFSYIYELNKANLNSNIFWQSIFIRTQITMYILCFFID